jgi:hypothetical protein
MASQIFVLFCIADTLELNTVGMRATCADVVAEAVQLSIDDCHGNIIIIIRFAMLFSFKSLLVLLEFLLTRGSSLLCY